MTLSENDQALADFLQMPEAVLEYANAISYGPLQGVLYERTVPEKNSRRLIPCVTPLLCVHCPTQEEAVAHLTQGLPAQLKPYGYMAFIMSVFSDLIAGMTRHGKRQQIVRAGRDYVIIGIYKEDSWEHFLRLQGTGLQDGVGPEDLIDIFRRWSQGCELVVLGAGAKFVTIYFPVVPPDPRAIAREAYDLGCEREFIKWITEDIENRKPVTLTYYV